MIFLSDYFDPLLKKIVFLEVDWSGRYSTPVGVAGQLRPHRRIAPRRLSARPTESEYPEVEID